MAKGLEVALDELEVFIQLIQIDKPELKKATYKELGEALAKEFGIETKEQDIRLLYEPTIEEQQEDMNAQMYAMYNNYWSNLD